MILGRGLPSSRKAIGYGIITLGGTPTDRRSGNRCYWAVSGASTTTSQQRGASEDEEEQGVCGAHRQVEVVPLRG